MYPALKVDVDGELKNLKASQIGETLDLCHMNMNTADPVLYPAQRGTKPNASVITSLRLTQL